jgi:hydrogenase maturation protease
VSNDRAPSPVRVTTARRPMAIDAGTVVLGLGNPILSDDAVGLRVAAALDELMREDPIPGVRVECSTRAGFELIDLLAGASHAIIVDCMEVPFPVAGRVRQLDLADVGGSARLVGAHDITVSVAFELAERLGIRMPATIEIIGVEGADTRTVREEMTPAVEAAARSLSLELHARLKHRAE